jgi:diguanylate cyclase (GGDEF)-like protein/PAS domain S-box-containing protein
MSLTRRLTLLLALALTIVVGVGALALRSRAGLVESGRLVAHTQEILQALDALQTDVLEAETGQRGYVITGEESYLEPFKRAVDRIAGDVGRLDALVEDPWVREHLDDLTQLVEEKVSLSRRIIGLRRSEGFAAAADLVRTNHGKDVMDTIRRLVADMRSRQREILVVHTTLAQSEARFANYVLVGGTLVSLLLIVATFLLLVREVAAHRRTERELRHSDAISQGVLTSMADGVVVADAATRVISMNPAAERLFGAVASLATSGITRQPALYRSDGRAPFDAEETPLARAVRGETVDGLECVARTPGSREEVWLSVSARPLRTLEGDTLGGVAVLRDVTAAKHAELALQESNLQLRASVDELERRNDEITLLGELSGLLQACLGEEEASRIIAQSCERLVPGSRGGLYLLNASHNLAAAGMRWGDPPPSEQTFAPDACWALRRGHAHMLESHRLGLRCGHVAADVGSYVCVPLVAQGEALGVLHARVDMPSTSARSAALMRLLRALADEIGLALANLRLRESLRRQSIRDPLTNLFNRRYMEESLERELQRATRRATSLALLMIDIDHFKTFNDGYGHDAGDALLCELGAVLQGAIRGEDLACRYGGEEFIVILPEASLEEARLRAETLRATVKGVVVRHQDRTLRTVSLSIGVAAFPEHGRSGKGLLQAADRALYRAKAEGRDRVVAAASEPGRTAGSAA